MLNPRFIELHMIPIRLNNILQPADKIYLYLSFLDLFQFKISIKIGPSLVLIHLFFIFSAISSKFETVYF